MGKVNKTAWILQHPNLGAAELVARAKVKGIELSEKYVSNIRSKARNKKKNAPKGRPGRPRSADRIESQFLELALAVGLTRAESLLSRARAVGSVVVIRRLAVVLALVVGVTVALGDVFVTMLCILSFGHEPHWLEPWQRLAWPAAHAVAIVSVMIWQVFLPERWKRG